MQETSLATRLALLAIQVATLAMIAVRIAGYPSMLGLPGAKSLLLQTVACLLVYSALTAWPVTWRRGSGAFAVPALRAEFAFALGLAGGLLQALHLVAERFALLPHRLDGPCAIAFELGTFALWGYAGFRARRMVREPASSTMLEPPAGPALLMSLRAAMWSALVTMTLTVGFGVLLEYFLAPIPLSEMTAWGEFQRSGWSDLRAFSIANTLDAASSHLLAGPIVAAIVGLIGFTLAGLRRRAAVSPSTA